MIWELSHRADPEARVIADRHYNRQKIGTRQFVPPGRCLVLKSLNKDAFWVTSWPYAEYVKHAWAGAFVCSAFRNEGPDLSSLMIVDALKATRWKWPDVPELGMITFVNTKKVRQKKNFGYCFLKAGFVEVGKTKKGLLAFQMSKDHFPQAEKPIVKKEGFFY